MNNSVCVCLMMNSQECVTLTHRGAHYYLLQVFSLLLSLCWVKLLSELQQLLHLPLPQLDRLLLDLLIQRRQLTLHRLVGLAGHTHTLRSGLLVSALSLRPLKHRFLSTHSFLLHLLIPLVSLCSFGSSCLYTPHESILTFSWCCVWDASPSDCVSSGCQIESDYCDSSVPYSDSTPANIYRWKKTSLFCRTHAKEVIFLPFVPI